MKVFEYISLIAQTNKDVKRVVIQDTFIPTNEPLKYSSSISKVYELFPFLDCKTYGSDIQICAGQITLIIYIDFAEV